MKDEELVEVMARELDKALADSLMRSFQALSSPPVPGRVIPPLDGKAVIRAALTALREAGYAVVPREATAGVIQRCYEATIMYGDCGIIKHGQAVWTAMIAEAEKVTPQPEA